MVSDRECIAYPISPVCVDVPQLKQFPCEPIVLMENWPKNTTDSHLENSAACGRIKSLLKAYNYTQINGAEYRCPISAETRTCSFLSLAHAWGAHIAQITPLSFQAAIPHNRRQVRWGELHASAITGHQHVCISNSQKVITQTTRENLKWKTFTTYSILVLQTPLTF